MVYLLTIPRREIAIKHLNQPFASFHILPFRAQFNFTVTSLSAIFQSSSCIMNEADPLYSSSIFTCVVNAFSAYTASMLNILTIHVVRKTSSLPKPLKHCFWVLLFLILVLVYSLNLCTSSTSRG